MFERRLRWFIFVMVGLAAIIVARLVQIQVVQAAQFEALADTQLTQPTQHLRAPRGAILDRAGRVLVRDVPTYDITLHFAILSGDNARYLNAVARELRRRDKAAAAAPLAETVAELRRQVDATWRRLAELGATDLEELRERAARIRARVEAVKRVVQRSSPNVRLIREENMLHALIENVDERVALQAQIEFQDQRWLRIVPSSHRVTDGADAFAHLIGRMGLPDADRIASDRYADDPLRALDRNDRCGVSGVELLADYELRGTRGRYAENFDRTVLEHVLPTPGRNVRLTIDADVQQRVLELLGAAVERSEHPAGGAAVVIDVETRDVVALASYPTYSLARFDAEFDALRRDGRRMPLRARAISNIYPPGSTCKVITLYGGLAEGVVAENARIRCGGHFLPNDTTKFRCWIYNQYPGVTHDMRGFPNGLNASDAIRNSCNIYFFTVGDRLGLDRLGHWFSAFGFGRTAGTGLIEEAAGIVPTSEWLARNRPGEPRAQPADPWNYSIGQGEVAATPLQAANVAATIAAGQWRGVHLARDETGNPLGPVDAPISFDPGRMRVLREGMWRVVNERGGTAHVARLKSEGYVLCGKTGSAQAVPLVLNTRYFFEWPDGRRETVVEASREDAERRFVDLAEPPMLVGWRAHERFPPWQEGDKLPAHAWFIGYTQPAGTPRGAVPRGKVYAISVLIEFGGSGGNVAAPIAREIAELLLAEAPEWG